VDGDDERSVFSPAMAPAVREASVREMSRADVE
jgi:hypothetical protein